MPAPREKPKTFVSVPDNERPMIREGVGSLPVKLAIAKISRITDGADVLDVRIYYYLLFSKTPP